MDALMTYDDGKRDRLMSVIRCGDGKKVLGKDLSVVDIELMGDGDVEKLYEVYEGKVCGDMVNSLGSSIIGAYSTLVCKYVGMGREDLLKERLDGVPFLHSGIKKLSCELYFRFDAYLAPLSMGIISASHWLEHGNKNTNGINGEEVHDEKERDKEYCAKSSGKGRRGSSERDDGYWEGERDDFRSGGGNGIVGIDNIRKQEEYVADTDTNTGRSSTSGTKT